MASNKIKGLTVEIGGDTTKLGKALDSVEKQGKGLTGELREINRLLKLDPSNVELLAQKQKVLADAVANTESKLDTLKEAERQVQIQFEKGEASEEQVRALQREIISTEKALDNYKRAAKETADAMDAVGKEAGEAAEEVEEMADEAQEAEKDTAELESSLDGLGKGLGVVAAAVAAAGAALVALTEETREYRREMGKLDTAFQDNGHSSEAATKTYKKLQGILGETDQAVEAANHLAALTENEEELAEWTEILTGVYGKFGASLSVESLAEAANETRRTGVVTGSLADSLNWAAKEGETFGVTMKQNIKFTEKSAEELKKMTKSQKAEYEARKKQYEEIETYNKAVEEAASAEDMFNIALANCTSEQERQELITKTLTGLYKGAAEQYKKTNKEVIRANEANEEWTATLAGVGEEMEPVLTDIKTMGTSLVKDLEDPLKSVVSWVRDKLLPALSSMGTWVKQNGPVIKAAIAGVTAAMVAYKVASVAAEVAQKGLKGAIMATTVAQKAMDLVMNSSPWGLIATAVAALVAGLAIYVSAVENASTVTSTLTAEQIEFMAAADEAAQSFRDQKAAADEAAAGITSEMAHLQRLTAELHLLADENGVVQAQDKERARFILNELNQALGTEYTMTGNIIDQYKDLTASVNALMQAKLAESLLDTNKDAYIAAKQGEAEALENTNLKWEDYQGQIQRTMIAEDAYKRAYDDWQYAMESGDHYAIEAASARMALAKDNWEKEQDILDEKKIAWEESAQAYGLMADTINTYESAQAAALSGNYDTTVDLLAKKGGAYVDYGDKVDDETARVLNTLYKEAVDAGIEAENTKKNFNEGVSGYTDEMVKEAEQGYQDALDAFGSAYSDAQGFGEDLTEGMTDGAEAKRATLIAKAKSLVQGFLKAARKEADSHSPSRKMMAFGEDLGEGAEIGIEEKTGDILKTAKHQVQAMLEVYNGADSSAAVQQSLTSVESRNQAKAAAAAASSAAQLDKILAAIERGQVLTIDGSALVGATAGKMDNTLGQRRALAARGAL